MRFSGMMPSQGVDLSRKKRDDRPVEGKMKTEREKLRADEKEKDIEAACRVEEKAAGLLYEKVVKEEEEEYHRICDPLLEKLHAFTEPFGKICVRRRELSYKTRNEALAEIHQDWKECPSCKAPASKYQTYCSNDKCALHFSPMDPDVIDPEDMPF